MLYEPYQARSELFRLKYEFDLSIVMNAYTNYGRNPGAGYARMALIVLTVMSGFQQTAFVRAETARRSDDFVESLGVATHWNYQDWVYNTAYIACRDNFYALGIRHMRSGPLDGVFNERLNEMYRDRGIRMLTLVDARVSYADTHADKSKIQAELDKIKSRYPKGMISALEGLNEYDENAPSAERADGSWKTIYKDYQKELYDRVSADSWFDSIPVGCGAMLDAWRDYAYFTEGELAAISDLGMAHHYPSKGDPPSIYASVFPYRETYHFTSRMVNQKPCWITETGYALTASETPSIKAVAKYLPRLLCLNFMAGFRKTFIHELADAGDFGLLSPVDGTPRTHYYPIKNLISLLQDAAWNAAEKKWSFPQFALGQLDYGLAGDTRDIKSLLFQKSNGKYYLLLWQEVDVYENGVDLQNAPRAVQLTLNAAVSGINQYTLYNESAPGAPLQGTALGTALPLTVNVPDHIIVLEISPATPGWWMLGHLSHDEAIGSPARSANTYHLHDRYLVRGGGKDIAGGEDSFQFASRPFYGDAEISARVDSMDHTNGWAKAGVMMRESEAARPGARYAAVLVTPANGIVMQTRAAIDGPMESQQSSGLIAPYWVRLVRTGDVFKGYHSSDGVNWIQIGTDKTLPFNNFNWIYSSVQNRRLRAGFAVTAADDTKLCQAAFSRLEFGGVIRRFNNRWIGRNLANDRGDDVVTYGQSHSVEDDQWLVKGTDESAWKHVINLGTGRSMHIQDWYDYVKCDWRATGDSRKWSYALAGDPAYNLIKNKWSSANNLLHIENLRGYAQHLNGVDGWHSAQWDTVPIDCHVTLRGVNDRYVTHGGATVNSATTAKCSIESAADTEVFTPQRTNGKVALKGKSNGLYLSSENGASAMRCNRSAAGTWELFDWIENGDGTISLRGNNGRYVTAGNP